MSDRTSARLFGEVFEILAKYVPAGVERDEIAGRYWGLTLDYDFSPDQMGADDALLVLGIARRGIDPDWPDDGEVVLYWPEQS